MITLGIILLASDQDKIIEKTIDSLKRISPLIIAFVDNPTKRVFKAIQCCQIIYDWKNNTKCFSMSDLLLSLEIYLKSRVWECQWMLRVDADEIWNVDVLKEIAIAKKFNYNVINFKLKNHHPLIKKYQSSDDIFKITSLTSNKIYKELPHSSYQRAWKTELINKDFYFEDGGHQIHSQNSQVYKSNYSFDHFYALDFEDLNQKMYRKFSSQDKKLGYNHHYKINNEYPK